MSEHDEQVRVVTWARNHAEQYPALAMLYAIPNGGARAKRTAARLKAEGVAAGVPDLCLAVPTFNMCGLYIEMKTKTGRLSDHQRGWLGRLMQYQYCVSVARSAEEAIKAICEYLHLPKEAAEA